MYIPDIPSNADDISLVSATAATAAVSIKPTTVKSQIEEHVAIKSQTVYNYMIPVLKNLSKV